MKIGLTLIIEVTLVILLALLSIGEGIRLHIKAKIQLYDILGPGLYNLGIGVILAIVAVLYLIASMRKDDVKKHEGGDDNSVKVIGMITAMVIYILLIKISGYFFASLVFFIVINRITGFKSWLINVIVSIGVAISFYVIFVSLLNMQFSRGLF